jgi:signal transduction histidine kinase
MSRAMTQSAGLGQERAGALKPMMARRSRRELGAVAVALVLVLAVVHPVSYSAPTLRAVMETVMALFAVAAAAMVREQFLITRQLGKLLLLAALVMLAMTEFSANALPPALDVNSRIGFIAAFPLGQLMAAVLLLAAARTPSDRVLMGLRRPVLTVVLLTIGAFGFAELVGLLLRAELLPALSPTAGIHELLQRPLVPAVILTSAGFYGWAAADFGRGALHERSVISARLAQAALLLGAARLYHLTMPWVGPGEITVREILGLLAFGFIFSAVLRGDHELRAGATRAATFAERRRVARDLHDGLAQDLALIAAHGTKVVKELGEEHPLSRAVRHALAVSRDTIIELSETKSTSPRESLEAIAHELGERFGTQIVVDVAPALALTPDTREQVSRIAREAIANAARHGAAKHILVSLKPLGVASVLRIVDDGRGIGAPSVQAPEGFGISSMRERAAALGGTFTVRPAGAKGTNLEVVFP